MPKSIFAAITAAPEPAVIAGITVQLSPLSIADLGRFEVFAHAQIADELAGTGQMSRFQAVHLTGNLDLESYAVGRVWNTRSGRLYALWLSLLHTSPDLPITDLDRIPNSANTDLKAACDRLWVMSVGGQAEDSADPLKEAAAASDSSNTSPASAASSATGSTTSNG